jgi:hypothetical protein
MECPGVRVCSRPSFASYSQMSICLRFSSRSVAGMGASSGFSSPRCVARAQSAFIYPKNVQECGIGDSRQLLHAADARFFCAIRSSRGGLATFDARESVREGHHSGARGARCRSARAVVCARSWRCDLRTTHVGTCGTKVSFHTCSLKSMTRIPTATLEGC